MAEPSVQFKLDTERFNRRLQAFVRRTEAAADRIVQRTALGVLRDTLIGWPVDTGASRAAWQGPFKLGPAVYQISNPIRYASALEYGGYKGVGPKTERFGPATLPGGFTINAGIYPRQRPAAPLRRALAKHYGEITKELKALHQQTWGR